MLILLFRLKVAIHMQRFAHKCSLLFALTAEKSTQTKLLTVRNAVDQISLRAENRNQQRGKRQLSRRDA